MLHARRLPAALTCLLLVGFVLGGATVVTLPAAAHLSRVDAGRIGPSSYALVRRAKCLGPARGAKRRKAARSCATNKSQAKVKRSSASRKLPGSWRLSSPPPTLPARAPATEEAAPPETPASTGPVGVGAPPESPGGSGLEPPGGSGSEPGETSRPIEPIPGQELTPPLESAAPFRFFSSSSFWNEPVSASAPLDPSSAGVVGAFDNLIAEEDQSKVGPWINTTSYSVPVYTVPGDQPTVAVQLVAHRPNSLSAAWSAVPLPPEARPAPGTDGDLVLWQPSTDRLWEFWRLGYEAGAWHASWGGAMQNVSSDAGVFGPEAWPEADAGWGVSASSLSLVGGLISLEDLEKGQINHALSISIPNVRAGVYASPAQRSDGESTEPLSLPEGAHLRLDPNLDLAALHLPRLTLMIAEAAQRYGIFVRDHARVVAFQAQEPVSAATDPYTDTGSGSGGYFEGMSPRELLSSFPWDHLELLEMELHPQE